MLVYDLENLVHYYIRQLDTNTNDQILFFRFKVDKSIINVK